jgi:four helix bundle protein
MEWFVARIGPDAHWRRVLRQLDEAGTSTMLNIAEGNGRYAELDHRNFKFVASGRTKKCK